MTTRRWLATAALLLAAIGLLWWMLLPELPPEIAPSSPRSYPPAALGTPFPGAPSDPGARPVDDSPTPIPPNARATPTRVPDILPESKEEMMVNSPNQLPALRLALGENENIEQQLDQVNLMLRDFRTIAGANPEGTNAEIMKAVMGDNPRQAKLGPPPGQSLNGNGELVDPWGTPYFFHQVSGREMEIRSAGADRKMWTGDDQTMISGSVATAPPKR